MYQTFTKFLLRNGQWHDILNDNNLLESSKEKSFRKNNSVLHCIIQGYRPLVCTCMHQSYKFAIKISVIDFVMDIYAYPMILVHITFHHMILHSRSPNAIFEFKKLCDSKLHKRTAPIFICHDWRIVFFSDEGRRLR